jgi:hypothetical protein
MRCTLNCSGVFFLSEVAVFGFFVNYQPEAVEQKSVTGTETKEFSFFKRLALLFFENTLILHGNYHSNQYKNVRNS